MVQSRRLRIVHDEAGYILAASFLSSDAILQQHRGGWDSDDPMYDGAALPVVEVDLPEPFAALALPEIADRLRVGHTAGNVVLVDCRMPQLPA
jgi:hypothetical protein